MQNRQTWQTIPTVNVMMVLILVYAAAAIFHQVALRDGLLMRMVRGR